MVAIVSALFFLAALCCGSALSAVVKFGVDADSLFSPEVPTGADAPPALLVIFPGMQTPAAGYFSLATNLANRGYEEYRLALYVYVAEFSVADISNPLELQTHVDRAKKRMLEELGYPLEDQKIVIAGHSLSGIFVSSFAQKSDYAGIVLLASYVSNRLLAGVPSPDDVAPLARYPKPVLTLGGTNDGLTRASRLYLDWASINRGDSTVGDKPVIILQGVNHAHFSDSIINSNVRKNDHAPGISQEEATGAIASRVSAFVASIILDDNGARNSLAKDVQKTGDTYARDYIEALSFDKQLCPLLQAAVIPSVGRSSVSVRDTIHGSSTGFSNSKPSLTVSRNGEVATATIQVQSHPETESNPADVSTYPVSYTSWDCKFISKENLIVSLNLTVTGDDSREFTCSELNQINLEKALSFVPQESLRSFVAIGGRFEFAEDKKTSTGITWLNSNVDISRSTGAAPVYTVRSPYLSVGLDGIGLFGKGVKYCKLVAVSRFVEIIEIDSLPPYQ